MLSHHLSEGKLKEWSLVLYGTSVHPYSSPHNEKPRSTDLVERTDEEFTEEYNGMGSYSHGNDWQ